MTIADPQRPTDRLMRWPTRSTNSSAACAAWREHADVRLRPVTGIGSRHRRKTQREGNLGRRLRRRERAAYHELARSEPQPVVVARRARDRVFGVSWKPAAGDPALVHHHRSAAESDQGPFEKRWRRCRCSPDGRQIAFRGTAEGASAPDLFVINVDGTNLRRLTTHPDSDTTPTWSPSGTQIAFTSDRTGPAADLHHERRRHRRRAAAAHPGRRGRSCDVGAESVQRDRLLGEQRPRLRHQGIRPGTRTTRQLTVQRGHEREPGVFAERPASRVLVHAIRARSGLHDRPRRQGLRQITRSGNNQTPDWSN